MRSWRRGLTVIAVAAGLVLPVAGIASATPATGPGAVAGVALREGWSYTDCGLPSDPFQLESLQVSPDPPAPGKDVTIKAAFRATETIEDGAYADVTVKLGLIKLLHKRFDLGEELRNADASIQLPLAPGTYTAEHTVALPREIPRAKFTVSIRAYTAADDDLACLDLKVDFMKGPLAVRAAR